MSAKKLEIVCTACEVLLNYFLNALHVTRSDLNLNTLQSQQYINAIRVLCIGKGHLTSTEFSSLVETMKGDNFPQHPLSTGKSVFKLIFLLNR